MGPRRRAPAADPDPPPAAAGEEPPPVLGSWRALYAVVLGELLLVILLCGWLSGWGR